MYASTHRSSVAKAITDRLPLLYVFLAGIGFSIKALVVKLIAESGHEKSMSVIFVRGVVQALLSLLIIVQDDDRKSGTGPLFTGSSPFATTVLWTRSLLGFVGMMGACRAVEFISIGDSTALVMMCPVISALAGFIILGESWRLPEFFASILSITGCALVVRPTFLFDNQDSVSDTAYAWGVFYSLLAAGAAGLAYVLVRVLGTTARTPAANICFIQALAQVVFSLPCLYLFQQSFLSTENVQEIAWILFAAVIGSVSQLVMTVGMQREKSASASAMLASEVITGYALQVLFTSDPIHFVSLCGAGLVCLGIVVTVLAKQSDGSASSSGLTGGQASSAGGSSNSGGGQGGREGLTEYGEGSRDPAGTEYRDLEGSGLGQGLTSGGGGRDDDKLKV